MPTAPPLVLTVLWLAWIAQALLSAWQCRKFLGRFAHPPKNAAYAAYRPPATVVVPFRGVDTDLEHAVRGLCGQDYPDYRLLLVVESEDDPAYPVLRRAAEQHDEREIHVLVAGPAGPNEGQKIHNQLCAIDRMLSERSATGGDQVWVFADSDAVPGPRWLSHLVGPLARQDVTGMTTGYRWLIPKADAAASGGPGEAANGASGGSAFWSRLASVINSSAACQCGSSRWTFAWGGSMAIRAELAQRAGLRGRLTGALCDDYQFTGLVRDAGMKVRFIHRCLVATPVEFTFAGLTNFAHRQYLLTRIYAPRLYAAALAMLSLYVSAAFSALAYLAWALLARPGEAAWLWPLVAMTAVFAFNQIRAALRRRIVRTALGEDVLDQLRPTLRLERWTTLLWITAHWLMMLPALFRRTMTWRGIRYRLFAPQRVERLDEPL